VPRIADFVAKYEVIVVSVDGYVARAYAGFYGGTPWDVMLEGGDYDFGVYFQELVATLIRVIARSQTAATARPAA